MKRALARHGRRLIWAAAAVVLLGALAAVAWHLHAHRTRLHAETRADLELVARGAEAAINRQLLAADRLLATQARVLREALREGGVPDPARFSRSLREAAEQSLFLRNLQLVDAGGRVHAAAREPGAPQAPLPLQALAVAALAADAAALQASQPVAGASAAERSIWLARALPADAGRWVILAELPLNALAEALQPLPGREGWWIAVERDDGTLLAARAPGDFGAGQAAAPPIARADADGRVREAAGRLDGSAALMVSRASAWPWLLVSVGVPRAALEAEATAEFAGHVGALGAFALLMLALAAALDMQWRQRERLRAQAALGESVTARLIAQTQQGFWRIDGEQRTVDANPAMCALLGTPRQALLGRSAFDFVDERNAEVFRREVERRRRGEDSRYEVTLRRPDGTQVPCIVSATAVRDEAGRPIGSIGLWTDITGLMVAQRELSMAKAQLDRALNAMQEGFLLFDRHDRLVLWNRHYETLFPHLAPLLHEGLPLAELHVASARHLLPGGSAEAHQAWIVERSRHHRGGGAPLEIEQPDGRVVEIVEATTADGGFVAIVRDVTRLRATERDLREAHDAAQAAAQAKSRFLAAMSHEIRTPLNAVLGMNGLLMETPLDARQRRWVELIGKSGESLLAIINDILDLSRLESGQFALEVVDFAPAAAVGDVVSVMATRAQAKELALELRGEDSVRELMLRGDPSRLRQVLFNLIGNAIKFTERGGVTLDIEQAARDDGLVELTVAVRDTGVGITAEALPRLFERFSQADSSTARRYGGTGLGLSICREIVELMGGRIEVQSRIGEGSCFSLHIPFERAEAALIAPPAADAALPASRSGLRLLVAEDNNVNQILVRTLLTRLGHRHDVVADGVEAVRQVQLAPYDLVLMDLQMPQMDGLAAARAIRALPGSAARVPIVAMTANVLSDDHAACLAAGMNGFVAKPIDRRRLQAAIDAAVGETVA